MHSLCCREHWATCQSEWRAPTLNCCTSCSILMAPWVPDSQNPTLLLRTEDIPTLPLVLMLPRAALEKASSYSAVSLIILTTNTWERESQQLLQVCLLSAWVSLFWGHWLRTLIPFKQNNVPRCRHVLGQRTRRPLRPLRPLRPFRPLLFLQVQPAQQNPLSQLTISSWSFACFLTLDAWAVDSRLR